MGNINQKNFINKLLLFECIKQGNHKDEFLTCIQIINLIAREIQKL